jgi:hypothetical protein
MELAKDLYSLTKKKILKISSLIGNFFRKMGKKLPKIIAIKLALD